MKRFAVLCIALFITLVAQPAVSPGARCAETAQTAVEAAALRQAFADDRSAAESRYIGKSITVTGIVLSTGMSIYLTPNVVLSDREKGEVKVICVLPRLDAGKLDDFKPGQRVTMTGRGYRLSERGVVMKECKAAP